MAMADLLRETFKLDISENESKQFSMIGISSISLRRIAESSAKRMLLVDKG